MAQFGTRSERDVERLVRENPDQHKMLQVDDDIVAMRTGPPMAPETLAETAEALLDFADLVHKTPTAAGVLRAMGTLPGVGILSEGYIERVLETPHSPENKTGHLAMKFWPLGRRLAARHGPVFDALCAGSGDRQARATVWGALALARAGDRVNAVLERALDSPKELSWRDAFQKALEGAI